jgi:thiol-disulfide isomerase/thioredoxin
MTVRVLIVIAALAVAASGCGSENTTPSDGKAQLLDGGVPAFEDRLGSLKGTPVVVNQWASWCGPCTFEFPFFAALAKRYKGEVAFLGVNAKDSRDSAEGFLVEQPVPYDNFFDPDAEIARLFKGGRTWPTTAYYGRDGELEFTHYGGYRDEADLEADIRKYALDG